MFLEKTLTPWFAVQRASQVLMILLAVAMLFIPVLTKPKEAEAASILCTCVIVVGALLCVCLGNFIDKCPGPCGGWGIGSGHEKECLAGHNYYYCFPNAGWLHATCTAS